MSPRHCEWRSWPESNPGVVSGSAVQRGRGPLNHHTVLWRVNDGRAICEDTSHSSDKITCSRVSSLGGEWIGHLTLKPPSFLSSWQSERKWKGWKHSGDWKKPSQAIATVVGSALPAGAAPEPLNSLEDIENEDHMQRLLGSAVLGENLGSFPRSLTFWSFLLSAQHFMTLQRASIYIVLLNAHNNLGRAVRAPLPGFRTRRWHSEARWLALHRVWVRVGSGAPCGRRPHTVASTAKAPARALQWGSHCCTPLRWTVLWSHQQSPKRGSHTTRLAPSLTACGQVSRKTRELYCLRKGEAGRTSIPIALVLLEFES